MNSAKKLIRNSLLAGTLLVAGGCSVPKEVAYFQDTDTETKMVFNAAQSNPIKIKPEDKLSIIVKSKDPEISNLFNMPIYSSRVGTNNGGHAQAQATRNYQYSGNEGVAVYTVDPQGDIDFPVIGKLHIAGMTRSELAGFIKGELMGRDLVKDPTVTVEFAGAAINVLGEVLNPGRFEINRDHVSVLDALAMAGDMTITGRRDNVRVIRKNGDTFESYTIDMTNADKAIQSPGFYLQQDDVVYIEPNDMRKRQTTVNGNNTLSTSFWISVASLITSAVTTIGVFINK